MKRPLHAVQALALLLFAMPLSCLLDPVDLGPADDLSNEFDLVWSTVDDHYVCFHSTVVDWDGFYLEYRPMAEDAESQDELMEIVFDMLSELEDPGVFVNGVPASPAGIDPNYDMDVLLTYRATGLHLGRTGLQLGLVHVREHPVHHDRGMECTEHRPRRGHRRPSRDRGDHLRREDEQRRHLGGAALGEVCRTFNPETRIVYFTVRREGSSRDDFSELHPRMVSHSVDCFTGPVVVLIGEYDMHVSEQFACMVSEIPSVTTIGDTTMRRPDHLGTFPLPADCNFTLPDSTIIRADSVTWVHEAGVPPDIFVDATPADFALGVDPVLEYALEWAEGRTTQR